MLVSILLNFEDFLYTANTDPLSSIWFANILSQSVVFLWLHCLTIIVQKILKIYINFKIPMDECYNLKFYELLIFSIIDYALVLYLRNICLTLKVTRLFPTWSFKLFVILGFSFRSMIPLRLIFVYCVNCVLEFFLLTCRHAIFLATSLEKTIIFPLNCFPTTVKTQLSIYILIYFWTFYFVPLTYISSFVPKPHYLN